MIDHLGIHTADLEKAAKFYEAVLAPIGYKMDESGSDGASFKARDGQVLFISKQEGGGKPTGIHVAFRAPSREAVDEFYVLALAGGAKDHGKPGIREKISPTYYAAFYIDSDGNNVEAVHHIGRG